MASKGTEVFYITGNHDEMLRKLSGSGMGRLKIVDKLLLNLDGQKTWIFHGDVFDISIQHAKWIAKLGGHGYDLLILLNRLLNWVLLKMGKERYSLSKKIKKSVKGAISYIQNFEKVATDLAIENDFDCVICGHIHQPKKEWHANKKGKVLYLNSGDWVENLTSLEYGFKRWRLYEYNQDKLAPFYSDEELKEMNLEELIVDITKNEESASAIKIISDEDELVKN